MSAPLPVLPIDKRAYERGLACVHCGLCLAACPTYLQTGREADSPRGRIQLIRGLTEGKIEASEPTRHHLDLCLDCRACETACPSGVVYHELIEEYRIEAAKIFPLKFRDRVLRWANFHIVTKPTRLKLALLPIRLFAGWLLPKGKRWPGKLVAKSGGTPSVGFHTGCVSSVLFASVNQKAADLIAASGKGVIAPAQQVCCGAIHYHNGDLKKAQDLARQNIDAFESGCELVVTTAAGCGAMLKEYDLILRDDPAYSEKAKAFCVRVRDITELLADSTLPPLTHPQNISVTYHDACHLAHGQKVTAAPRKLLAQIPGLKLIPLPESDQCCGAAGTYFLTQPEMAAKLADRKLANIASTGASVCVIANAGCTLHLCRRAAQVGEPVKIVHPVELLYAAAFGDEVKE
jgi:glycolate oxidase iron-sulfur subunit